MESKLFEPFVISIKEKPAKCYEQSVIKNIIEDLWKFPFDEVSRMYNIPKRLVSEPLQVLNKLNIKLEISPYQDYIYLRKLPFPKFLITTGFTNIHNAKIN